MRVIEPLVGQQFGVVDSAVTGAFASTLEPMSPGWAAKLELNFDRTTAGTTRLKHQHLGPLRIQKALYPEGPEVCHAIIVHPPGGIAGGDHLEVSGLVDRDSHGLVTTPSAAKWYGSDAQQRATQRVDLHIQGAFEWLPQETIVFDRARVDSTIQFDVGHEASLVGWDHLIFGRKASGESFVTGCFTQSLKLLLDGELIWHDRLRLNGADPLFNSVIGLRGYHAFATVWAVLPAERQWTEDLVQNLRARDESIVWTSVHPRLIVGRVLTDPLVIKLILQQAWANLRALVFNLPAVPPRLCAT